MHKDILDYYERELAYLKQEGANFADTYPSIASHLRLTAEDVEDPHVSRLLEGVAFLNAGIHQRLDDDFNELTDSLLNQLYPHYQDPIPSFSIAQFVPKPEQNNPISIPQGCVLETQSPDGSKIKFTTLHETQMEPFFVADAQFQQRPFNSPGSNLVPQAESLLKLALKGFTEEFSFQHLTHEKLRFFIRAPFRIASVMLEMLGRKCLNIVAARDELDVQPVLLPLSSLRLSGYAETENLLPYRKTAQMGYRILSEFFLFPEKFLFFELDIDAIKPFFASDKLMLNFYCDAINTDLERAISSDCFALNCTPIVNLFAETSEPIRLDHTQFEYQLLPSIRHSRNAEIISIESVEAISSDNNSVHTLFPFFGINHEQSIQGTPSLFWHSRRKITAPHSQLMLSFTDLDLNSLQQEHYSVYAQMLCSNGNLPETLPFGGGQPKLYSAELTIPLENIRCVVAPTPSVRQAIEKSARWRVVSHLNLNQLSLNNSDEALPALKEMLRLYDFTDSASTRAMINALIKLSVTPCAAAVTFGNQICMARGLDIELEVDEAGFTGSNLFIFGQVLQHFFSLYCSINSFTRLTLKIQGKEGIYHQWTPILGQRSLL